MANLINYLSLLMLLISLSTPTTTASDDDLAVLDTNGDPLIAGGFYYAVPASDSSPLDGGLTMYNNGSDVTCPDYIVSQSQNGPQDTGIPLTFFPQDTTQTQILHGFSDYNIGFKYLSILPECRRLFTTVWTVSTEDPTLVLDGELGDETSWFKIKKSDDNEGYIIRYSSTSLGGSVSKDVGVVSNEQGASLLSTTILDSARPLVLVFVKA